MLLAALLIAVCGRAALADALRAEAITLTAPHDGGTPRDPARIQRLGPCEFRVRASVEEGRSPLTHAVSRVDLVCRNAGLRSATVTLHVDLSGDGKRPDFEGFGPMPQRDFVFIQPPGQPWRQIDGKTDRWVATVTFPAPPGETKVGLSPWYTYADLLGWLGASPKHPHLEKKRVGHSDGGREHWELLITDPTVSAEKKKRIFWHAREHAYESWSSFAMEGLVEFLLSEEAAGFRRRYAVLLHPMTNVDGVAQGFEYRGGYDFPDPRGTASARVTFDAVDRLRPDFAVTWHNWIAPRDRNVVFFTDGENGKPTPRAWLRFTQLFPSLHAAGHRWKDENAPLRYNWEGRRDLSEANVHQYAMKRYGTRVWGWEMPWWNLTVEDSRRLGAAFARALLTTLDEICADKAPAATELPVVEAPRWEMYEFTARGRAHVDNPFRDAALVGEFTSPSDKSVVVDGFFDGDDTWRLRFAPNEEGEWTYLLRGEGVEVLQRGRLRCTPPRGHGFIGIHPQNPYAFAYADGTPLFPMGDTCYGLYADSPITPALRSEYLQTRRAQRFNFVRMGVLHSPSHGKIEPDFWPWGGTPARPDLDRFNPRFFRGLDALLAQMKAVGMNAELVVLNYYQRPFTDTKAWTPQRARQWLRYVTARYAAFSNLFLWTIANEYETHPDGAYRLDFPGDPEWAKANARFIKQHDPYHRPVTVHPVISSTTRGRSPGDPFDAPWQIGRFFGTDDAMDVLSQQTGQSGKGVAWDEKLRCWTGSDPDLVASLRADRRYRRPVLNSESGYEYLRGHPTYRKQVHHTDKVRRSAWRIVCAGGYFSAGFAGSLGMSDFWNADGPERYPFVVKDEGAGGQLAALYDFWTSVPYWRMRPFDGATGEAVVALADPGKVYVVYLPVGGKAAVDLGASEGPYSARWFDPRRGKSLEPFQVLAKRKVEFTAPDRNDWVLKLEARH